MSIGWGIYGIGNHSRRSVAPAINRASNTEFVSVCSRSMDRAKAFAAEFKAKKAFDSYEEMLKDPELDVIYISTPNNLHAEHTIQAARAGKHVLCEKPMALTVADSERMIEVCAKEAVKLGINFQNRHHPAHVEARRLIEAGKIGQITLVTAQYSHGRMASGHTNWRSVPEMVGAGALTGTGLHPIDLLRFILGSEITEVRAFTDEDLAAKKMDEMAIITLEFANGVHGMSISGLKVPRAYNHLVVYGTDARITGVQTVGMPLQGELLVDSDTWTTRTVYNDPHPMSGTYMYLIEAFNKCVLENGDPNASGQDGLEMVRVLDAILESSRSGKVVKINR
ncbi:MAG: Gfo/Idh/MocA family oxidoreductase [Chloroflexi bacterium]|nr:Gfo/Idh/MocA family oxidoreductase [Chloroflexota bacterium]